MAAANNEFFEALSMLEHERGITAEYLIDKIKAAIIIAVKKNYEVEDDHVMVEIDPETGRFNVALIQDVVADEDWYDEHSEIGITEAQKIRAKLIRPNADGVRELAGILTGREGTTVTLDTDNGPVAFEVNAASSVQLCDDEDLFD